MNTTLSPIVAQLLGSKGPVTYKLKNIVRTDKGYNYVLNRNTGRDLTIECS